MTHDNSKTGCDDMCKSWNDLLITDQWIFSKDTKFCLLNTIGWRDIDNETFKTSVKDLVGDKKKIFCTKILDGFLLHGVSDNEIEFIADKLGQRHGIEWNAFEKEVPSIHKNGFFIEGAKDVKSIDIRKYLMQFEKQKNLSSPEVTNARDLMKVMYSREVDISKITKKVGKTPLDKMHLQTKLMCHSDCIRIGNLKEGISNDLLRKQLDYLFKQFKADGAITDFNRPGPKVAFVYFSHFKDAAALVKLVQHSENIPSAFGLNAGFRLHYHPPTTSAIPQSPVSENELAGSSRGSTKSRSFKVKSHPDDDEMNAQTSTGKANKQSDNSRASSDGVTFCIRPLVSYDVMAYLQLCAKALDEFKDKFVYLNLKLEPENVHAVEGDGLALSFKCSLSHEKRVVEKYNEDQDKFLRKTTKLMEDFLSKYKSKTRQFDPDEIRAVRSDAGWEKVDCEVIQWQTQTYGMVQAYVKWNDLKKGNVTIAGENSHIDEIFSLLKKAAARQSQPSTLRSVSQRHSPPSTSSSIPWHKPESQKNDDRTSVPMAPHVVRWFIKFAANDSSCGNLFNNVWMRHTNEGLELIGSDDGAIARARDFVQEMSKMLKTDRQELIGNSHLLTGDVGQKYLDRVETTTRCALHLSGANSLPSHGPKLLKEGKLSDTDVIVRVVETDITEHACDAIVNASNTALELRDAGVSGSILRKGGPYLLKEMQRLSYGKYFRAGSAVSSCSGNLPCKRIIHAVGPVWNYRYSASTAEQELEQCIFESLSIAEREGLTSVAFPCISSGVFGGKPHDCAEIIITTIGRYIWSKERRSIIKRIDLVEMFNQEVLQEFIRVLDLHSTPLKAPRQKADERPFSSGAISNKRLAPQLPTSSADQASVKITVKQGDLTSEKCDAIVNPSDCEFSFKGQVGRQILAKGGKEIEQDIRKWWKDPWQVGTKFVTGNEFHYTPGHRLPCKKIFHIPMSQYKINQQLTDLLYRVFVEANSQRLQSIALPAIGTGNLGGSVRICAGLIKTAIDSFALSNPKHLHDIRIVIFDKHIINDFKKVVQPTENTYPRYDDRVGSSYNPPSRTELRFDSGPPCLLYCAKDYDEIHKATEKVAKYLKQMAKSKVDVDVSSNNFGGIYPSLSAPSTSSQYSSKNELKAKVPVIKDRRLNMDKILNAAERLGVQVKYSRTKSESYLKITGPSKEVANAREVIRLLMEDESSAMLNTPTQQYLSEASSIQNNNQQRFGQQLVSHTNTWNESQIRESHFFGRQDDHPYDSQIYHDKSGDHQISTQSAEARTGHGKDLHPLQGSEEENGNNSNALSRQRTRSGTEDYEGTVSGKVRGTDWNENNRRDDHEETTHKSKPGVESLLEMTEMKSGAVVTVQRRKFSTGSSSSLERSTSRQQSMEYDSYDTGHCDNGQPQSSQLENAADRDYSENSAPGAESGLGRRNSNNLKNARGSVDNVGSIENEPAPYADRSQSSAGMERKEQRRNTPEVNVSDVKPTPVRRTLSTPSSAYGMEGVGDPFKPKQSEGGHADAATGSRSSSTSSQHENKEMQDADAARHNLDTRTDMRESAFSGDKPQKALSHVSARRDERSGGGRLSPASSEPDAADAGDPETAGGHTSDDGHDEFFDAQASQDEVSGVQQQVYQTEQVVTKQTAGSGKPTARPRKTKMAPTKVATSAPDSGSHGASGHEVKLSDTVTCYNVNGRSSQYAEKEWAAKDEWKRFSTSEWALCKEMRGTDYFEMILNHINPDLKTFTIVKLEKLKNPKLFKKLKAEKAKIGITNSNIEYFPLLSHDDVHDICARGWNLKVQQKPGETLGGIEMFTKNAREAMWNATADENQHRRIIMADVLPDRGAADVMKVANYNKAYPIIILTFAPVQSLV